MRLLFSTLFTGISIVLSFHSFSQLTYDWGITGGEAQSSENSSNETVIDANGYRYTIGTFNGTVDLNPNGAPYMITSNNYASDIFIAKYHPNGQIIWAKALGGASHDLGYHVTLTNNDQDLVIGGLFDATVDFDLSPAVADTFYLYSAGAADMFVAKYDTSGVFQWADQFACGTNGTRWLSEVAVDNNGLIYAYGHFDATVDFDPDLVATNYISSNSFGFKDLFIVRLLANGDLDYVNTIGSSASQFSSDLILDGNGNYILSGRVAASTVDFDPGPGVANFTSTTVDGFVMKYTVDGAYVDGRLFSGPSNWDEVHSLAMNSAGDKILIAGEYIDSMNINPFGTPYYVYGVGSEDIFFGIYNTSLELLHGFTVGSSSSDAVYGILYADTEDHIMLYGSLTQNNVDIDPSPYVTAVPQNQNNSTFLAKYDSVGNYIYSYQYEGLGTKLIYDIDVEGGKLITSGKYYNEIDLDLGAGVDIYDSPGTGYYLFNAQYTECSGDYIFDELFICEGDSSLIFGNYESSTGAYYDYYSNINGCDSIYRTILVVDTMTVDLGPDLSLCEQDTIIFSAGLGYSSYLWTGGWGNYQYEFIANSGSGTTSLDVEVSTTAGCVFRDTVNISVNANPTVDLGTDVVLCEFENASFSTGAYPLIVWSDGATGSTTVFDANSGPGVFPLSVVVTDNQGCSDYDTVQIIVNPAPVLDLGPNVSTCEFETVSFSAGTHPVILWADGSTNADYYYSANNGVETHEVSVIVSSAEGCTSYDTVLVTVNALPQFELGADTTICEYNDITVLGPAGMGSYLWQDNSTGQNFFLDGQTIGSGSHEVILEVVSTIGCSNVDTMYVTVDPCLGLEELAASVNVYPNPTSGQVTVEFGKSKISRISVSNTAGQVIYKSDLSMQKENHLFTIDGAKGIYFVTLVADNGSQTVVKIVKY